MQENFKYWAPQAATRPAFTVTTHKKQCFGVLGFFFVNIVIMYKYTTQTKFISQ